MCTNKKCSILRFLHRGSMTWHLKLIQWLAVFTSPPPQCPSCPFVTHTVTKPSRRGENRRTEAIKPNKPRKWYQLSVIYHCESNGKLDMVRIIIYSPICHLKLYYKHKRYFEKWLGDFVSIQKTSMGVNFVWLVTWVNNERTNFQTAAHVKESWCIVIV